MARSIFVLTMLMMLCGSAMSSLILYCPSAYCVTPKLGTTFNTTSSDPAAFDCFNKASEEIAQVTTLDSSLANYPALDSQLTSSGYSNARCKGLPTFSNCNNRGSFSLDKRRCICQSGWSGPECMEVPCAVSNCYNQGYCVNGTCDCYRGFTGAACEFTDCPELCNGQGKCVNGTCACYSGYTGPTCAITTCPNDCSFQGECLNNACECDPKYTGVDCSIQKCPNNCYESLGHGFCVSGQCVCASSWAGDSCEVAQCPNKCSGHGFCDSGTGICNCSTGYTGHDCSQSTCQYDCGEHGRCLGSRCQCDEGYALPNCIPACKYNCSGQGVCASTAGGFACFCNKGRTGQYCETTTCPAGCSGHGSCDSATDKCVCDSGYMGVDCSLTTCHGGQLASEGLCSGNGYCMDNGACQCADGWRGEKCSIRACPNNCNNRGICTAAIECQCDAGWAGLDCSTKTCPNDCAGHGRCGRSRITNDPVCICDDGFGGLDCSEKLCPRNCSNHGSCVKGVCFCTGSFVGDDCSILPCGGCSGHGQCNPALECICESGWVGSSCQINTCVGYPQNECSKHGMCVNGTCRCVPGFSGDDCSISCPTAYGKEIGIVCSGHGKCLGNQCACNPAWTGTDCNMRTCPSQCNGHGSCNNGTCVCVAPYSGEDCSVEPSDGAESCDCSMNCTVLCLRQCSGVHDRYGMFQSHQCYQKCNQFCLGGCATSGEPTLNGFIPSIDPKDLASMVKSDSTVLPEDLQGPLSTVDVQNVGHSLIQDAATALDDEHLPTME